MNFILRKHSMLPISQRCSEDLFPLLSNINKDCWEKQPFCNKWNTVVPC